MEAFGIMGMSFGTIGMTLLVLTLTGRRRTEVLSLRASDLVRDSNTSSNSNASAHSNSSDSSTHTYTDLFALNCHSST